MKDVQVKRKQKQAGFVMLLVLLLIAVLLSAGMFGLKMLESDTRSFRRFNRNLMISRSAAAGAAHRLSQIETAKNDPMSAVAVNVDWTSWPTSATPGATEFDMVDVTQYAATSVPILAAGKPPAGEQVGSASSQTVIWEIRSYAIPRDGTNAAVTFGGEFGVAMGVKLVTSGSQSYNMD